MAIRVNNNIIALNTQRSISRAVGGAKRQLERLSSGLRVNRAMDDASGLVVSEGLRSEAAKLNQNVRNAQQGSDMLQVAEGSLQTVNNIMVRMRELAIQSSTSTINDANRESIAAEFGQLVSEIDRIVSATAYNNRNLLAGFGNVVSTTASTALTDSATTGVTRVGVSAVSPGTFTFSDSAGDGSLTLGNGLVTQTLNTGTALDGSVVASGTKLIANFDRLGVQVTLAGANTAGATGDYTDGDLDGRTIVVEGTTGGIFQVGPTDTFFNRLEVGIPDLRASGNALNLGQLSVSSIDTARAAIDGIDQAIRTVANARGDLGVVQNRLSFTIGFTESEIESITASDASIRDADIAREVTEFVRNQVLVQASNAMLVQVNVTSIGVLSLL
ncbi:MAG: flagellin [Candidatus Latescibacterota bacterium]